jgi:hypothetical protein
MDSLIFSRELTTVDLQIRRDHLNSLGPIAYVAVGMPRVLFIWNEKRPQFSRRPRYDVVRLVIRISGTSVTGSGWVLDLIYPWSFLAIMAGRVAFRWNSEVTQRLRRSEKVAKVFEDSNSATDGARSVPGRLANESPKRRTPACRRRPRRPASPERKPAWRDATPRQGWRLRYWQHIPQRGVASSISILLVFPGAREKSAWSACSLGRKRNS